MGRGSYDVIVVGAGFGGSTCAALLANEGLNVLLLEKNAKAGGKAMAFSKKGFTYDAWMIITAPVLENRFEVVLKQLEMGSKVELVAPQARGARYKNSSGKYELIPEMPPDTAMDPNVIFDWLEVKEEERVEALRILTDITLMSPQDIDTLDDISFHEWLRRYQVPKSLYSFLLGPVCDACFMVPVDALAASEAIKSLQDVFLRNGGLFCKGGIGRVAETFTESVSLNGGKVIMRARVERITVEHGEVTGVLTDRGSFQAPIVVSNAGIQPTVLKLIGEEHFDLSYVNYVKDLIPSWGMMGARYFLNKNVIEGPYGVIFSDESYWNLDLWLKAKSEGLPKEVTVWFEMPSNYDPDAAPPGKHIVITGFWCPSDPQITDKEKKTWWAKGDEMMFNAFPDLPTHIESTEYYSTHDVSVLTRDQVLPGQGGECIGLGQVVGQCGRHKPSVKAPLQGLFYVGCDAGGRGIGTQHAVDSGINVANTVLRYHRLHQATL